MPVNEQELRNAIIERLQATYVDVKDVSSNGCGQMYEVIIVSKLFEGKTTLARHRLVNNSLKDEISRMHAFSQKSYTPKQFSNLSS